MAKKLGTLTKTEQYSLQFQDLMDAIPTSTVIKHVDEIEGDRSIQWVINGYSVHSSMRDVYSIGLDEKPKFEFFLKANDYNKFVQACETRRAQILEQLKTRKK